jgi:hypothetical protein
LALGQKRACVQQESARPTKHALNVKTKGFKMHLPCQIGSFHPPMPRGPGHDIDYTRGEPEIRDLAASGAFSSDPFLTLD